ncbi:MULTISPECIES: hypothetical protein [unclassified Mammaliicoccus]|nr:MULTISPECIES: hypothetical protein [unclassified Mammaliicoccus]
MLLSLSFLLIILALIPLLIKSLYLKIMQWIIHILN